jgi:hypothetical protein
MGAACDEGDIRATFCERRTKSTSNATSAYEGYFHYIVLIRVNGSAGHSPNRRPVSRCFVVGGHA